MVLLTKAEEEMNFELEDLVSRPQTRYMTGVDGAEATPPQAYPPTSQVLY